MSSIGPKDSHRSQAKPADAGRMDALLERLRKKTEGNAEAKSAPKSSPKAATDDGFSISRSISKSRQAAAQLGQAQSFIPTTTVQTNTMQSGQGVMSLRLGNLTGDLPARAGSVRIEDIHLEDNGRGKTVVGDLLIRSAEDLAPLLGAVTLKGNLEVLESGISAADLEIVRSLQHIEGNLVLEGNRKLGSLTAFKSLRAIDGNIYAGYNDALTEMALPKLQSLAGALIVEGNLRLQTLNLPALTEVERYLHLHENDGLQKALLPSLSEIGGEVSILDNPKLVLVEMSALPALSDVEIAQNGADRRGLGLPQ